MMQSLKEMRYFIPSSVSSEDAGIGPTNYTWFTGVLEFAPHLILACYCFLGAVTSGSASIVDRRQDKVKI